MEAGKIANQAGNSLEKFIEQRLIEKGYNYIPKEKFKPATYLNQSIYTKKLLIGKSIYDNDIHCDFVIFDPNKHPKSLIIDCKWQQSSGSVDEKFPYVVANIQQRYPYETIVILDGGGYKKKAEKWLREQVSNNLLHVFNMAEFQIWVNEGNI